MKKLKKALLLPVSIPIQLFIRLFKIIDGEREKAGIDEKMIANGMYTSSVIFVLGLLLSTIALLLTLHRQNTQLTKQVETMEKLSQEQNQISQQETNTMRGSIEKTTSQMSQLTATLEILNQSVFSIKENLEVFTIIQKQKFARETLKEEHLNVYLKGNIFFEKSDTTLSTSYKDWQTPHDDNKKLYIDFNIPDIDTTFSMVKIKITISKKENQRIKQTNKSIRPITMRINLNQKSEQGYPINMAEILKQIRVEGSPNTMKWNEELSLKVDQTISFVSSIKTEEYSTNKNFTNLDYDGPVKQKENTND